MPASLPAIRLTTLRTALLDATARDAVVQLCVDAHGLDDFRNLFSLLPPDGLHILASGTFGLIGHAVVTTRQLQVDDGPLLRTAYVDAVSVLPSLQGQGVGRAVMTHLSGQIGDYDIACLETDKPGFTRSSAGNAGSVPSPGGTTTGHAFPPPARTPLWSSVSHEPRPSRSTIRSPSKSQPRERGDVHWVR